jgi:hypothetical protein
LAGTSEECRNTTGKFPATCRLLRPAGQQAERRSEHGGRHRRGAADGPAAGGQQASGRLYWGLLTLLQIAPGLQVVVGLVVLAAGRPPLLHYTYGAVVPALLVEAHLFMARLKELPNDLLFINAAAVNLPRTARALPTDLGPEWTTRAGLPTSKSSGGRAVCQQSVSTAPSRSRA